MRQTENDNILRAVVIADSSEHRFRPLTLTKPRCLLPIANSPMIEYTLEFLAAQRVDEIFVFVKSHADQIKEYIQQSKWSRSRTPKVIVMVVPNAHGVGDVMREIDAKSLIDSDFVLVSGNVVSNMNLHVALEAHRKRRMVNPDSIMTMVMKKAAIGHRSRAAGETALIGLNPSTNEVLMYDLHQDLRIGKGSARVQLELDMFKLCQTVQLRDDLIDSQIDICSAEVLALFTENFDYLDIRRHFVHGILSSDLLKKNIYVHVVEQDYASRVRSTQTYDSVSKDIIERWSFPMVPDSLYEDITPITDRVEYDGYHCYQNNIYKEHGVYVSNSAIISSNCMLGRDVQVGKKSRVTRSTLGRKCSIGSGCSIINSYLWQNVQVGSNCSIDHSIIADNVVIGDNVTIERGCVLSYGVVIGEGIHLKPYTKLTCTLPDEIHHHQADLGVNGKGMLWNDAFEIDSEDDDDYDELDALTAKMQQFGFRADKDLLTVPVENEVSAETDFLSEVSSVNDRTTEDDDDYQKHITEVEDTFKRAVFENHTFDNAVLELNALKMACNINYHDIRMGLVTSLVEIVNQDPSKVDVTTNLVITQWTSLFSKFVTTQEEQLDLISLLVTECCDFDNAMKLFHVILIQFYQHDVIEEDAIIEFDHTLDASNKLKKVVEAFVNWLSEAESESSGSQSE